MEKRWLLRLGPPLLVAVAIGLGTGGQGRQFARAVAPAPRPLAPQRPDLRVLAPDIAARGWLAERGDGSWAYGQAGTGTVRSLPRSETGIAIGARLVASGAPLPDARSRIFLREWRTGSVVATIDAPIWVSAAAFRGDDLVATGYADARAERDGGIHVIRPDGHISTVIRPGHFPASLHGAATRGSVFVSPNGVLAASYLCRNEVCEIEVVELATRRVFRPSNGRPGFLRALTDSDVVVTDADAEWIVSLDARSGRQRWRIADSILMTPVAGSDRSLIALTGSRHRGWAISRIDSAGRTTDVTTRSPQGALPLVWPQLSTAATAVVAKRDFAAVLGDPDGAVADLVNVAEARIVDRDVQVLPGSR